MNYKGKTYSKLKHYGHSWLRLVDNSSIYLMEISFQVTISKSEVQMTRPTKCCDLYGINVSWGGGILTPI